MSACVLASQGQTGSDDVAPRLAGDLVKEGDHHGAAIEFRRMALNESDPRGRGGFYWAAAYEYWRAGEPGPADKMLDLSEKEAPELGSMGFLLRGETALAADEPGEAKFYYESILKHAKATPDARNLAARRAAGLYVRDGKVGDARRALENAPGDHADGRAALDIYAAGRDKRPGLGGLLGVVPGLGYAYSGEYANGLRCLLLNSLFIWGMVDTADDEEWGAFAVITFFEFTWYSGSIYGGVDSAHRHNRRRTDRCVEAISGISNFSPDYERLPTLALKFEF